LRALVGNISPRSRASRGRGEQTRVGGPVKEAIVRIQDVGQGSIDYVNPADDPRKE